MQAFFVSERQKALVSTTSVARIYSVLWAPLLKSLDNDRGFFVSECQKALVSTTYAARIYSVLWAPLLKSLVILKNTGLFCVRMKR